jgi:hypothetical protein
MRVGDYRVVIDPVRKSFKLCHGKATLKKQRKIVRFNRFMGVYTLLKNGEIVKIEINKTLIMNEFTWGQCQRALESRDRVTL